MEYEELTSRIIACAINVHRELGPGFLETIYERALVIELQQKNFRLSYQGTAPVYYRERNIGDYRYDILVEETIVIELKAIKRLEDVHFAQVRSYLKAMGLVHGLIFNFSSMPLTIRRVIFEDFKTMN
jgi:GxxExxY protein